MYTQAIINKVFWRYYKENPGQFFQAIRKDKGRKKEYLDFYYGVVKEEK